MRRELADLRRDLCKELRAFNSNFNTFTQHYNTWSPQGASMAAGADIGLSGGAGAGTGTGSRSGAGAGAAAEGLGTSTTERGGTGGAREKKPQVSKVSVGTQARSKVLVRQSTADAAVNCPEEKEDMKGARRSLPKQLSMDPSILACPQSMYVESAIPLSLDPILPGSVRAVEPEPFDFIAVPPRDKPESAPPDQEVACSSDTVPYEPVTTPGVVAAPQSPQDSALVEQEVLIEIDPASESSPSPEPPPPAPEPPSSMKSTDSEVTDLQTIQLPYPVPVVTVSPPDDHDDEVISDSESPEPVTVDKPAPDPQEPTTVSATHSEDPEPPEPTGLDSEPSDLLIMSSSDPISQDPSSACNAPTGELDTVPPSELEIDIRCPSIVVSEYFDLDSPISPTDSDTSPEPIITLPDDPSDPPPEPTTVVSTFASSSAETQDTEPDSQDPEWPPLPEPLDSAPIYHADLVHFDLVMLTSLDQDDLDSVFMDPEPEPFDMSIDSPSNTEDLEPPMYHSDCPGSSPPAVDPAALCSSDPLQSTESVCSDQAVESDFPHMPHVASQLDEVPLPQVTVTISPPSSVSRGSSVEMDFGPTSPSVDPSIIDPLPQDPEDIPSAELPQIEPDNAIVETVECVTVSQECVAVVEEETTISLERSSSEEAFLWCRWQRRGHRQESMHRSSSVELWSGRYEYNSAEITYVSLTL